MKDRKIIKKIRGKHAIDGAGVHLVRVLGGETVYDFDPFLMLDSFDSKNPDDYIRGFPVHPHRGIETVTYLISGKIEHTDSLGNRDTINPGEAQWMCAGSGIMHEEMPLASDKMLGFQLWLNLPGAEKMAPPHYLAITREMIPVLRKDGAEVLVISGKLGDTEGVRPKHIPASIFDVTLEAGKNITVPTAAEETVFVFFVEGNGKIDGEPIAEKTAVLFGDGEQISVSAAEDAPARFIFFSGKPLREPISWGGPIVMNTREELSLAFEELRNGTFIK